MLDNKEKILDILLVEDEKITQKVIENILKSQGWNTTIASDGEEAIEYLQSKKFDLALIDIHIPKINGLEIIKTIQNSITCAKDMGIILMTAGDISKFRVKSTEIGADEYIEKPIDRNILLEKIKKYIYGDNMNTRIDIDTTLDNLDGDIELLVELIQDFIDYEYIEKIFSDIEKVIEEKDYTVLYKRAHKLKGSTAFLNIHGMHKIASTLEMYGKNQENNSNMMNLFNELKEEYYRVERVFNEYINSNTNF
ncbi:MAG: response regulator [Clostridiales bacterium]|nr:response regulator [Clostridiales bacterium]